MSKVKKAKAALTIENAIADYRTRKSFLEIKQKDHSRTAINSFVAHFGKDAKLDDITDENFNEYFDTLLGRLSPSSVRRYKQFVGRFFREMAGRELPRLKNGALTRKVVPSTNGDTVSLDLQFLNVENLKDVLGPTLAKSRFYDMKMTILEKIKTMKEGQFMVFGAGSQPKEIIAIKTALGAMLSKTNSPFCIRYSKLKNLFIIARRVDVKSVQAKVRQP